jgi:cardiolipin synthase (CMP-forming)
MRPVTVADYLSLVRIPLGVMFLLVADHVGLALGVLAAAGLSDVLDGWVARRQRRKHAADASAPPHRGDWLDPLCDKLFVLAVVLGLYIARRPPPWLLGLLLTREVLQTISVTVMRLVPSLHRASHDYDFKAHPLGKATTVVQFLGGALLLLNHPLARLCVYLTAALAVLTVAVYISRVRRILPGAAPRTDR